jgi:hypothetical protein
MGELIKSGVENKHESNKVKHKTWQEFAGVLSLSSNHCPLLILLSLGYNLWQAPSCNLRFGCHPHNWHSRLGVLIIVPLVL